MSAAAWEVPKVLVHQNPWTEEEFLALPERRWPRVELLDGGLLVTPAPTVRHQQVARRLAYLLEAAAPQTWEVAEGVNVRTGPSRIPIPDVVVATRPGDAITLEAAEIALVAEVVSPSTVQIDRRLKPGCYAEGGIPWYLRVELEVTDAPEVIAYRLKDDAYVETARARAGQTFRLSEPVEVAFDPAVLLRR